MNKRGREPINNGATTSSKSVVLAELKTVEQFDAIGQFVQPEELDPYVRISSSLEQHIEWLQQYTQLGFDEIILHNVNREQKQFIEVFGEKVLSTLT